MKEKILDAVAALIERYSLKKFTMNEVAAELSISKKTLYQYFASKDEMIKAYFEENLKSDRLSVMMALKNENDFLGKIHAIVHSSHHYKMPVRVLNEAKQFYPEEWQKIEELKAFKLEILQKLLKEEAMDGKLRSDINFAILSSMLERVSDMFIDSDFLLEHGLKSTEAIDQALDIIINGIIKK